MCNILFSSLCRKTEKERLADNQQETSINTKQMRLQTGWPGWCWFTLMGLEYKCPSLHYHSHKRLVDLCLPIYQYNLPSCIVWFWACDSVDLFFIFLFEAVLCWSKTSAWFHCFDTVSLISTDCWAAQQLWVGNAFKQSLNVYIYIVRKHLALYRHVYSVKYYELLWFLWCHSDCILWLWYQ